MTPHDIAYRCYIEFIELHGTPPTEFWMDIHTLRELSESLFTEHQPVPHVAFSNEFLFGIPIRISSERGIWAAMSVGGNPAA